MVKYKDYDNDEVDIGKFELNESNLVTTEDYRPKAETISAIQGGERNQISNGSQESLKYSEAKYEGFEKKETIYGGQQDNMTTEVRQKAEKAVKEDVEEKISKGYIPDHATSFKGIDSEAATCETIGDNSINLIEEKHEMRDINQEVPKNFRPEAETITAMQDVTKSKYANEWDSTELQNVEVLRIDTSKFDKLLQFEPDFFKTSECKQIKEELSKLNDVIMPAVKNGADKDYFKELDRSEGRTNFTAGCYQDVYERFYGNHRRGIRLTKADGDFEYDVDRGQKYTAVAFYMGLSELPAYVLKS